MTSPSPRVFVAALSLGSLLVAVPASVQSNDPPNPPPAESPEQVCKRCREARDACQSACSGPSGDKIPSDSCLQSCTNAYYRCIPVDRGCD